MIKLFITKQDFANIVLLIYILVFYISGFDNTVVNYNFGEFDVFFDNFLINYPISSRLFAGSILMLQALVINIILKKVHYSKQDNLLGGLFFIFLNVLVGAFLNLTPLLIINSFLLFSLYQSVLLYNVRDNIAAISNIGLMIGFSMLFNPVVIVFMFFGFMTLNIYRPFKLNEKLALIISAFIPYFLLIAYRYYFDIPNQFSDSFFNSFSFVNLSFVSVYFNWIVFGVFVSLILVTLINPVGASFRKVIEAEKFRQVIFWLAVSGVMFLVFVGELTLDNMRILSIPIAIMMSIKMLSVSKVWGEVIHILSIILILFLLVGRYYINLGV